MRTLEPEAMEQKICPPAYDDEQQREAAALQLQQQTAVLQYTEQQQKTGRYTQMHTGMLVRRTAVYYNYNILFPGMLCCKTTHTMMPSNKRWKKERCTPKNNKKGRHSRNRTPDHVLSGSV